VSRLTQVELLIPELLAPLRLWARDYAFRPQAPLLEHWLGRARREAAVPMPWELRVLELTQALAPAAPARDPVGQHAEEGGARLRVEPVHLIAGADGVVLSPEPPQLDADEASAFCLLLNDQFADRGWHFESAHPGHWTLSLPTLPRVRWSPPSTVLGRDLRAARPTGEDARAWRAALTEIEMLLYDCEANQRRARAGRAPINSLWIWGEERDAPPQPNAWASLSGGDGLATALLGDLPPLVDALAPGPGRHLVVITDLLEPARGEDLQVWSATLARIEHAWIAALMRAWRAGRIQRLRLWTDTAEAYVLEPAARWRVWRRPCALTDRAP
jgi:hypothetical protein